MAKKYELWVVMDFEKTFLDENKFRDEYAEERFETFLDVLNMMNKDLTKW